MDEIVTGKVILERLKLMSSLFRRRIYIMDFTSLYFKKYGFVFSGNGNSDVENDAIYLLF